MPNDRTTFVENMTTFGLGDFVPTMEEYQEKLIAAVKNLGGVGEMVIKIKYKLDGESQIMVIPDITPKYPKKKLTPVSMFTTKDHKLAPHNPAQLTIDDTEEVEPENLENVIDINKKSGNGGGV